MSVVEKAYEIARKAHQGQVDKAGVDYIKHPETVASYVTSPEAKAVAYLHDVIEDSDVTADNLRQAGIPDELVEAVLILTKTKGEPYQEYLERVKTNDLARLVKIADLKHNSDLTRLKNVTETDRKRRDKYQKAINFLST